MSTRYRVQTGPFRASQISDGDHYELSDGHAIQCLPARADHAESNLAGGTALETDPDVLLQVMDHGTLTDTNGKASDFRQVILLMTSNVGAREMAQRSVGFGDVPGHENVEGGRAYERLFSPEFRNRLDARLQFNALTPEIMKKIVDKMMGELRDQLAAKKVSIELSEEGRKLLADKGHDPAYGARPLGRVIEEEIKRPMTEEILFGRLAGGGRVKVDAEGEAIVLGYETVV